MTRNRVFCSSSAGHQRQRPSRKLRTPRTTSDIRTHGRDSTVRSHSRLAHFLTWQRQQVSKQKVQYFLNIPVHAHITFIIIRVRQSVLQYTPMAYTLRRAELLCVGVMGISPGFLRSNSLDCWIPRTQVHHSPHQQG